MVELPSIHTERFKFRRWHLDALLSLAGVGPSIAWGVKAFTDDPPEIGFAIGIWFFAITLAVLGSVKAMYSRVNELKYEPSNEPETLVEWCKGLHRQLKHKVDDHDWPNADIRITIHKVKRPKWDAEPTGFQQITNYVGGKQLGLGREFSIRPGIIGVASRFGAPLAMTRNCDNDQNFIEEMVLNWGYTWDEASDLCSDRMSWMAVPLTDVDGSRVIGIIYLDSAQSGTFTEQIQEQIVVQSETLAETIRNKYHRGSRGNSHG